MTHLNAIPAGSIKWQVTDFLALRGTAGTTFRAPQQRDITPGFVRGLAQFNLPGVGSLRVDDTVSLFESNAIAQGLRS